MSAQPRGDEPEDDVDASHLQPFDAEPVQQLGEDEAPSPTWLPVLGVCLVIALGLFWSFSGERADDAPKQIASSAPSAVAPPPAVPAAAGQGAAARLRQRLPNQPVRLPNQPTKADGTVKLPSAANVERIQRMIRQRREAEGLKPPPAAKGK